MSWGTPGVLDQRRNRSVGTNSAPSQSDEAFHLEYVRATPVVCVAGIKIEEVGRLRMKEVNSAHLYGLLPSLIITRSWPKGRVSRGDFIYEIVQGPPHIETHLFRIRVLRCVAHLVSDSTQTPIRSRPKARWRQKILQVGKIAIAAVGHLARLGSRPRNDRAKSAQSVGAPRWTRKLLRYMLSGRALEGYL